MFNQFYNHPTDDRAIFANMSLKMLYQKYNGDLDHYKLIAELKILAMYFDEYVRNIYECIDREIPLLAYNNYLKWGFDESSWDLGEMTEDQWLSIIKDACVKHYED